MSAFVCGTFALALGLGLVLDVDDDEADLAPVLTTGGAAEAPATAAPSSRQKSLKAAKPYKLRAKRTAYKKRGRRLHLHESGPPNTPNPRPRRELGPGLDLGTPAFAAILDDPHHPFTRCRSGAAIQRLPARHLQPQQIRGPPPALLV